jgi:hypothetical protein
MEATLQAGTRHLLTDRRRAGQARLVLTATDVSCGKRCGAPRAESALAASKDLAAG